MTDQPPFGEPYQPPPPRPEGYSYPPPAPGGYPPPPPSTGGYAPPPPGPVVRALPTDSYTPWFTRVLAYLVDIAPIVVLQIINQAIMAAAGQQSTTAALVGLVLSLAILAYGIWNWGYRQGTTGSSIGKSVLKFKVVSEATGQPLGFGMSVVRQIAHFVDAIICYIGYLFPLWDAKRQTLADKIMSTVCLPL